ncbi:dimethylaniline monooxygenase [N-oxide-forming] [Elysia marginata]|uniref:Flavin-containing monooxygenase n=1 Tax=Elysia marginata TaxID=1093978 RepID=A0AAV4JPR2_9GAST|nr:dimethylaniline monooxygenase [N-oxide-forming] [Elysia marginata]
MRILETQPTVSPTLVHHIQRGNINILPNITKASEERWYHSARHTIQRDPVIYNDEIATMIGAKPHILSHPSLAFRLLLGSGGAAQWRLDGPNKWEGAAEQVRLPNSSS